MKLVMQRFENSCVPACIAMVSGLSHAQAIKLFAYNHNWGKMGSDIPTLMKHLTNLGCKPQLCQPFNIKRLRCNAILGLAHPAYGPHGWNRHVVVWDYKAQKVLDPYPCSWRPMKRALPLFEYQNSLIEIIKIYK